MRVRRNRDLVRTVGLLLGAVAAASCSKLSDVEPEQCGNRVVEAEEECDSYEELASSDPEKPSRCAEPGEPNACGYVWDEDNLCPVGWKPGQDHRCRRPSGQLDGPLSALDALKGRRPQVVDIDLDGQLDVVVDSPDGLATLAFYLAQTEAGFDAAPGAIAGPNAALHDLTGDGFADVASTVELSAADDGLSGIIVQRGNAARRDDPRLYPGPNRFPGEVILSMVPRLDAAPDSALDLDFAYSVYWDPDQSCGGPVCYQRGYFAPTEPLPLLDEVSSAAQLAKTSVSNNRAFAVLSVPGIVGHIAFAGGAPPERVSASALGFMTTNVGGITAFPGQSDVGAVMRSATKWVFVFAPGKVDPKSDWFPAVMATVDALGAEQGPAFGFINGDNTVDVIISGASQFELTDPWKRGGVLLSQSSPGGGDLFQSHVIAAGAALDEASAASRRWTRHTVGDFNGDGLDDVAAAYEAGATPGIEIVLGGELLPLASSLSTTALPVKAITATDFDGDGLVDVVVAIGEMAAQQSCGAPDEIRVAFGRAAGFPEPFVRVGGMPGVTQMVPGRFELPADGVGDVGIASRCVLSNGMFDHRTTIVRGSSQRRPYAPFILNPGARPRRVLSGTIAEQAVLVVSGELELTMIPTTGDAELSAEPFSVPESIAATVEPLALATSPSSANDFVLASLTDGWLRLDALSAARDTVSAMGEPKLLLEVPSLSRRSPHWSLAALPAAGDRPTTLAAVALQEVDDQDGDGAADQADNCPSAQNSDQGDVDGDLAGDACDDDIDGDGVLNAADNCPKNANLAQPDADDDQLGDACDADADDDGLQTDIETFLGLNPLDPDTDGDTIEDGIEFGAEDYPEDTDFDGVNDALDPDSDNDGVPDSVEAGPGTFPRDADADGTPDFREVDSDADGVDDGPGPPVDNCRLIPNLDQLDSDSDGVGDACENLADTDSDTVPDLLDNCGLVTNADQANHDGDLEGDACDIDDDDDAVVDTRDNCPLLPAAFQNDNDGDAEGDACDIDDDNDDVIDIQDNCPSQPNRDQLDADGDALGDACDDVITLPQASRYSLFALLPWSAAGELGAPLAISLPEGSQEFVDVVSFEGEGLERWLFVATDADVFRVGCSAGELPACEGGEAWLLPAKLKVNHLTGLASGDFTGDGLDDLLIIDDDGARVVPQLPL